VAKTKVICVKLFRDFVYQKLSKSAFVSQSNSKKVAQFFETRCVYQSCRQMPNDSQHSNCTYTDMHAYSVRSESLSSGNVAITRRASLTASRHPCAQRMAGCLSIGNIQMHRLIQWWWHLSILGLRAASSCECKSPKVSRWAAYEKCRNSWIPLLTVRPQLLGNFLQFFKALQ